MSQQFSPHNFFRRVPKPLLARFFQERHDVLHDIDFNKLKVRDTKPIFDAFESLPDTKRLEIEAECQDIEAMATEGGITALIHEAIFHEDRAFKDRITAHNDFLAAVTWAFVEHPNYMPGGSLFYHQDKVSESMWKKRNDLPKLQPGVEPADIKRLEQAICDLFATEGRGRHCKVEVLRRIDKEVFFAYPEDFAQSRNEWMQNVFRPRAGRPAFEIIFVYCQREGSLDIYAPRNTKRVPELQRIFAKAILQFDDLPDSARIKPAYELDALAKRDFVFKFDHHSGIQSARIKMLKLSLLGEGKRRITFEADPTHMPDAIHNFKDKYKLDAHYVSQATIEVVFHTPPGKRPRKRSFNISVGSFCALRHEGNDSTIRQMLIDSGIEPHRNKPEIKSMVV